MICWSSCTCKTLATWPRKPGHLAGFFYSRPLYRFRVLRFFAPYQNPPGRAPGGRRPYPARMRFLDLVPGRKPGAWSAPRFASKPARRIESAQRFSRCGRSCGGAAAERKNPRPGAKLRGPRCTGRAWRAVDLVTWAAPGGPVAVVPGAQLFDPRLVHALAVIRSQVSACVSSYSRAW